ncbi:tetratricopeptide repeat protein [Cardiobacteriaceae bacterium TAE3-ERU3]|nr:tetratricopeptide repeat protein [Cardiobacteriaceae bacterium TAE3-ERU3]
MRLTTIISFFASLGISSAAYAEAPWSPTANHLYDALTAQFLDHSGDYVGAMDTMANVARDSREYDAYRFAYNLAIDALNYAQAEKIAREWVATFPRDQDANWALVRVLLATDRVNAAYDVLNIMLKRNASPHQIAQLSRYLTNLSDSNKRLILLKRLADKFSDNPFLYYYVGLMAKEQGRISLAIEAFDRAIALDGRWQELRLMQAQALASTGRLQDASQLMDALVLEDPDNEYLLSAYVDILVDQYQWEAALAIVQKWQAINPDDLQLKQLQAWLASNAGQVGMALACYQELLDSGNIDFDQYLFNIAGIFSNAKEDNLALAMLVQIGSESVLYMLSRQQIALNAFSNGDIQLGQERFAELRDIFPDYALDMYLIELAQLDEHQYWLAGDKLLDQAFELYPQQVDLLYAKAEHLVAQGENAAAIDAFAELLAFDPANIDALNAYGYLLLTETERHDEGAEMIRAALAAYPDAPAIQDSYAWLNYLQGNIEEALLWSRRAYAAYRRGDIVPHYIEILLANGQKALANEVFKHESRAQPDNPALQALAEYVGESDDD